MTNLLTGCQEKLPDVCGKWNWCIVLPLRLTMSVRAKQNIVKSHVTENHDVTVSE